MKIVSFSRAVPYAGVPHAGGLYLHRHLAELSSVHSIHLVVPGTSRNIADAEKLDLDVGLTIGPSEGELWGRLIDRMRREFLPAQAPYSLVRAVQEDSHLRAVIQDADIIEFQWSENVSLAKYIRRLKLNSDVKYLAVVHDVLSQKYSRRRKGARRLRDRIRAYFGVLNSWFSEDTNLRSMSAVIVFSEKDKGLLSRAVQDVTHVVSPPLFAVDYDLSPVPGRVLFTGALGRPENDEAVRWFLTECWPSVKAAVPKATFVVAGSGPTPGLQQLAAESPDVVLTGYVDDVDRFYPTADVFINPVHAGAGVKFKTVTAMLYGLPIVSTDVGAEGVGNEDLYCSLTNDSDVFAQGVIRSLQDQCWARGISRKAMRWAEGEYGKDRFMRQLRNIYEKETI